MSIPVITISREYGSGGRAIGERLAKELGIPFYDKELIFMAAKESGLSEEYIKKTEQMKSTSFLYGLYMGAQQLPMNDQIFLVQSKIIRQVASEGPCVIVGRCADYVLRERKDLLNVFIHAPLSFRAERAQQVYEKQANNMEEFVRKKDKKRASFYNYFSQNKWGDARHYHLAISSVYGVDFAVEVLKQLGLTPQDRKVVAPALAVAERTGAPAAAMEMTDGKILTGKTSELLGCSSALLLNALKYLGNIPDEIQLISPSVIEPVQNLKVNVLGNKNPRLHIDELLVALSICAVTDANAKKAVRQLQKLRGCEAHTTVILSEADEDSFRRLGVRLTSEPKYQTSKLYHG